MKKLLGIDLGTSSVKLLLYENGSLKKVREKYTEISPDGFITAVIRAAGRLDLKNLDGIGLSSQVGTYIINGETLIPWSSDVGIKEIKELSEKIPREVFKEEISMYHPRLSSYPLPRYLYIGRNFKNIDTVEMPKDYLIRRMTGKSVADKYSYRGLANLESGILSRKLLTLTEIPESALPEIKGEFSLAGKVTKEFSLLSGIPEGTPVITGLNDFFAGLLGLGAMDCGTAFDITGTSEHFGIITEKELPYSDKYIGGPYLFGNAFYGVTASSGDSVYFAKKLFPDIPSASVINKNPPIFLPYLNGERCPVFDSKAKGSFVGIGKDTDKEELAYSVYEGVAFSIFDIYETLGAPQIEKIVLGGGNADNKLLALLKAGLFGKEVIIPDEPDSSALGAMMSAYISPGEPLGKAIEKFSFGYKTVKPDFALGEILKSRYKIYKTLYPSLKSVFSEFDKTAKTNGSKKENEK